MFDINKYAYYKHDNEIIAVSTYAGRTVKGIAKCHPGDAFSEDKGAELAAARCQQKVSRKRLQRAQKKQKEAYRLLEEAVNHYNKMVDYLIDSAQELSEADANITKLLAEM